MKDLTTGWIEADVVVNGEPLTFAESMALRVAVSSYRMYVNHVDVKADLGFELAEGYDRQLTSVEDKMRRTK